MTDFIFKANIEHFWELLASETDFEKIVTKAGRRRHESWPKKTSYPTGLPNGDRSDGGEDRHRFEFAK